MKKITLLFTVFFLLTVILAIAQKIQVKKGIVSKDDEPVAKLEGEATFAKGLDITLKSMTDEPLLHIKNVLINYHNVFYGTIQYYAIDFLPLNQSAGLVVEYTHSSEKKLIEYLYATIGLDFLNKDGLNKDQINKFLASKDESKKIHADTTRTFAIRNYERERLKNPVKVRNFTVAISLRSTGPRLTTSRSMETFDIYQDNKMIGKITKTISSSAVAPGGTPTQSAGYIVTRKVEPFSVDGETFEFANLARVIAEPDFPINISAYCERTWAKDLKLSNILAGEQQIVLWLIEKGCL